MLFKIEKSTNARIVVSRCEATERKLNNQCFPSCNSNSYEQQDGTCDSSCPNGWAVINGNKCVRDCPEMRRYKKLNATTGLYDCVSACDYVDENNELTCKDCDLSVDYFYVKFTSASIQSIVCASQCPSTHQLFVYH